jgi:hypothetical protein
MEGYEILEELSATTAKVRRTRTDKLFATKKVDAIAPVATKVCEQQTHQGMMKKIPARASR